MKKMSELIQREQEKKAYKSDISKDEYKDFTFQKQSLGNVPISKYLIVE